MHNSNTGRILGGVPGTAVALAWLLLAHPAARGASHVCLFVQIHNDDIVFISSEVLRLVKEGNDVHSAFGWKGHPTNVRNRYRLTQLGVPKANIHPLPIPDVHLPSHYDVLAKELEDVIAEVRPNRIYVQGWCGDHFQHDFMHALTVYVVKRMGWKCELFEYSNRCKLRRPPGARRNGIDGLLRCTFSFPPVKGARYRPVVAPVSRSESELLRRFAISYGFGWGKYYRRFPPAQMQRVFSSQVYRKLPPYDYTKPPRLKWTTAPSGRLFWEEEGRFLESFSDMRNYVLNMRSTCGAIVSAAPFSSALGPGGKKPLVSASPGRTLEFTVHVKNKGRAPDTFTLTIRRGDRNRKRTDITTHCVLTPNPIRVPPAAAGEITVQVSPPALVPGRAILWLRVASRRAKETRQPTDFMEIPYVVGVTPRTRF